MGFPACLRNEPTRPPPAALPVRSGVRCRGARRSSSGLLRLQERLHEVGDDRLDARADLGTARRRVERALALENRAPGDEREEVAAQDRRIEVAVRLVRSEDLL